MDHVLSSFHEIPVAIKVCIDGIDILQEGDLQLRIYILLHIKNTNRTSLGNIMEPRNGYISYKIYTQISLSLLVFKIVESLHCILKLKDIQDTRALLFSKIHTQLGILL